MGRGMGDGETVKSDRIDGGAETTKMDRDGSKGSEAQFENGDYSFGDTDKCHLMFCI